MALPRPPNAGKPWTPEESETLRRLAETGMAPNLIADRLGRSAASVASQAEKLKVSIGRNSTTHALERREARRRDAEGQAPG